MFCLEIKKIKMSSENKNDIYSKILKYKLAVNYFYTIIDEVKNTTIYKQKIKNLLNNLEQELDKQQKEELFIRFYELTSSTTDLQENLKLHDYFFNKLSSMPVQEIEEFMIDFVTKNK